MACVRQDRATYISSSTETRGHRECLLRANVDEFVDKAQSLPGACLLARKSTRHVLVASRSSTFEYISEYAPDQEPTTHRIIRR